MKKAKLILWLIIFGFFAIIILQNQEFFFSPQYFQVNLYVAQYQTPSWPNWVYFLISFALGVAAMFLVALPGRFRAAKTLKTLQATTSGQRAELDDLRHEISALVRGPEPTEPAETPIVSDSEPPAPIPESDETQSAE